MNMERDIEPFIKLVFPTSMLGDYNLTPLERLLLIYILSLCKKKGYCWATNEFFSDSFNVSKQTISKSISSLSNYGYIVLKYDKKEKNNSKRKIIISEVFKKRISDIQENLIDFPFVSNILLGLEVFVIILSELFDIRYVR